MYKTATLWGFDVPMSFYKIASVIDCKELFQIPGFVSALCKASCCLGGDTMAALTALTSALTDTEDHIQQSSMTSC